MRKRNSAKTKRKVNKTAHRRLRVLYLPGLGADRDMYVSVLQFLQGRTIDTHFEYIPAQDRESIHAYALRALEEQKLSGGRFDVVVGTSMGGMIGQIAVKNKWILTRKLVLINTAFSGDDLTWFATIAGSILRLAPRFCIAFAIRIFAIAYPFLRRSMQQNRLFARMILRVDPRFISEGIRMILQWRGVSGEAGFNSVQVIAFHGTNDPVISFEKIKAKRLPEGVVQKGNHVIFASLTEEIVFEILKA